MSKETVLNELVGNLGVLYIKLHQHHFYVKGEAFFRLHQKFEDYYNEVHEQLDEVAERLLMIKGKPVSTLAEFLEVSSIKEAPYTKEKSQIEMVKEVVEDFKVIVSLLEKGIDATEGDHVSQDMLIGIKGFYDKELWMLEATLG
ncbi:DNA starvation/stationary phase protection protein [Granulicatella sp. zg-ZJ]|uniref:Dps family protein n=1 Tax=unclassified Granulicatella TaxID=2630493 RepID=UPI0013BEC421|nr:MULTISPECIES: DNA starvation/stationary phase protection protein [unclassified Granulicatella]MBS4750005.1 DNA starvation/stationary phase protection protein [Carnobacteriaceae bacterium zg-ZUI78]NEW63070.1 DNA starvation/stationary phase protection protein [Granulicatella sp. zg-ZJ]NEW66882.1 DNA starvation/stationary phase protection protein [Granulicatella sp. zg-84]QMI86039.1 DNA starvation/stationary phase protection protein [Carnobacteriaceae bacterium zg-84]